MKQALSERGNDYLWYVFSPLLGTMEVASAFPWTHASNFQIGWSF
jgi:hypothetical protein